MNCYVYKKRYLLADFSRNKTVWNPRAYYSIDSLHVIIIIRVLWQKIRSTQNCCWFRNKDSRHKGIVDWCVLYILNACGHDIGEWALKGFVIRHKWYLDV